jgi:hypothetical protein
MIFKKLLPYILLLIMAVAAIAIRHFNESQEITENVNSNAKTKPKVDKRGTRISVNKPESSNGGLDRNSTNLYFTKHAKCRMKCRHITQQEIKDILANGEINYNKSDLKNARGPKYAVEGITKDRQRVRIIFAPTQAHISVVTVIDLEVEYTCNCN